MSSRHLTDEEIQGHLDGDAIPRELLDHLKGCEPCGLRATRYRSLFRLFDRLERLEPSPSFEGAVAAKLFPRRARRPVRIPAWAGALVPILLLAGSASLYAVLRHAGVLAELAIRLLFRSDPGLVRGAIERVLALSDEIPEAARGLAGMASVADSLSRAAFLAWETPQLRLFFFGSMGVLAFLAIGWGTRMILTRTKGGHHHVLLA